MDRTELEKLISDYIDDELSPQNKTKVEALVKTNAQAKSILDDYLAVRTAIQQGVKRSNWKTPADFSGKVLAAINANVPPAQAYEVPRYDVAQSSSGLLSRLKNRRVFAYPLIVLFCALLLNFLNPNPETQNTPQIIAHKGGASETPVMTADNSPDENVLPGIQSPLAGDAGTVDEPGKIVTPQDMKVVCQVENLSAAATVFPQVFAKHDVNWTKSTSGPADTVIYEISVTHDTVQKILADFKARRIEITKTPDTTSNAGTFKLRFQVEAR